jgi:predicted O-methyltransferase YrrM
MIFQNLLSQKFKLSNSLTLLEMQTIEVNNFIEIKRLFKLQLDPILDQPDLYKFEYEEDLNERRLRDAESLGVIARNIDCKRILEIGTSDGKGTVLLAANAPAAEIYTINIPLEEIERGEGGSHITHGLTEEQIGKFYKERQLKNIHQIFANTANWVPDLNDIDLAFIDGCHDKEFVINDTVKIMKVMRPGGFIIWHDFNPKLISNYKWIREVSEGINELYKMKVLKNRIYQVKDSWCGIYRV